jgi:DegV family protein with EDD domain
VVPLSIVFDDGVLRDGIDITAERFVERLRAGEHPTTSQPPPAAFLEAFRRAAEDGETVLGVILASALSGTFASAEAAARMLPEATIRLFDSKAASITQGLLLLKAAELGEAGWKVEKIQAELTRIRAQSGVFFTVDVFDHLLASGRVGKGQVMIAGLLDIKPILGLNPDGRIQPYARVRGSKRVAGRMMDLLEEKLPRAATALRFGIIHVGRPEIADQLVPELTRRWGEREVLIAPASPVLATHLGPGAWGLAWMLED